MLAIPRGVSDRIGQILTVLDTIQVSVRPPTTTSAVQQVRTPALGAVAETQQIYDTTVHSHIRRGLDLRSIHDFDALVVRWINYGDQELQQLLEKRAASRPKDTDIKAIRDFFQNHTGLRLQE